MGESSILSAGADFGKASHLCMGGLGFSPLGETGEGFWFDPLCPSDISPKYDKSNLG